jgi:hypothetical protein
MKTLYLLPFFSLIVLLTKAQESFSPVKRLGVTFSSFGENDIVRINGNELIGGPSYYGKGFYTLGFDYIQSVGKLRWLEFETGVEFSRHKIEIKPAPFIDASPRNEDFSVLTIPLTLRVNFLRYLFINGGVMVNFDGGSMPIDSQTGLGSLFGAGLKYDFKSGLGLFVNPYARFHSLVPLEREDNRQQVLESGFRFGIVYTLK